MRTHCACLQRQLFGTTQSRGLSAGTSPLGARGARTDEAELGHERVDAGRQEAQVPDLGSQNP